jgi:hypothetical protein
MFNDNVHKNQLSWQTRSRNLIGPKTLPTIRHTYMKLVTKYQIPVINSCLEKCDEKCAYMFNVYKNQLSRQTGSRNLTGPKMLPTIWHTYMKLVTKYQIPVINSCWEKCAEKYLGTDGRTEVKQYIPPSGGAGVYKLTGRLKLCLRGGNRTISLKPGRKRCLLLLVVRVLCQTLNYYSQQ